MELILSIDTALEEASVCLSEGAAIMAVKKNSSQMDHAAWIQNAIKELFDETQRNLKQLSAVAVSAGPGSYTGLRVGMATAKGICYALDVPLITESTLMLIAQRVNKEIDLKSAYTLPVLICPMIDARRMEVFTTLYDTSLHEIKAQEAVVLDQQSFADELNSHVIIFCGNGSKKWQNLCLHTHAVFVEVTQNVADLAELALKKFNKNDFSDLAYTEPAYLKNVYTGKSK